jgi:hypothetical protein
MSAYDGCCCCISFVSPVAEPFKAGEALSLFDTIHDCTVLESDWEHYYQTSTGEEEEIYHLMEDLAKDLFYGGIAENERPEWTVDLTGKVVIILFDRSRKKVWKIQ